MPCLKGLIFIGDGGSPSTVGLPTKASEAAGLAVTVEGATAESQFLAINKLSLQLPT